MTRVSWLLPYVQTPIVLERAGIIKGKKVTSYPGWEGDLKDGIYEEER